ncbi:MAG: glycosyltransferase family 39 protein [Candidatus Eisenbacteria bacterium]|nr:glycosyltransferase family 39 protein [Candidatus Eisenbacteria bacterium]
MSPTPRAHPGRGAQPPRGRAGGPAEVNGDPGGRRLMRAAWALAAALGAALVWMALGRHPVGDYFAESDFYGAYADGARLLQHGHLDASRYAVIGPVYEALLALAGFLVTDLFRAAQLLSALAAVACVLLWHRLLRRVADGRVALLAVAFVALNPHFFHYGYAACTDLPAVALQAAALCLLVRSWAPGPGAVAPSAGEPHPRASGSPTREARAEASTHIVLAACAGLVAALAFLTRYNAVYLLPAGIAAIAWRAAPGRRARSALLFAVCFLAPVAAWTAFCLANGVRFQFQLHHDVAAEVFAHARNVSWDDYAATLQPRFRTPWDVLAYDPVAVAARLAWNTFDHLRLDARDVLGWVPAACAAAGVLLSWTDPALRRLRPVTLAGACLYLTLVPVFHSARYSVALVPFYAALAAGALLAPRFAPRGGRGVGGWLRPLVALLPLAFTAAACVRTQAAVTASLPVEILEVARTLRPEIRAGDRVVARKAHLGYYAGLRTEMFPAVTTLPELAAFARARGARWLYFSFTESQSRFDFWYLLDSTATVPGLTLRAATRRGTGRLYFIGPEFGALPAWFASDTLRALHHARTALAVDSTDVRARIRVADALLAMGELRQARAELDLVLSLAPADADARRIDADLAARELAAVAPHR